MRYIIPLILAVSLLLPSYTEAQEGKFIELPPNATEEDLERAVKQRLYYIDKLLGGESVRAVEESGNEKALELLEGIRNRRAMIDGLIAQRRFREAFVALHNLHASIMDMLRIAKQEEVERARLIAEVEDAMIMNNALFQKVDRLLQESTEVEDIEKVLRLVETAKSVRAMADANREAEEFQDALDALRTSSKLLKKAIRLLKADNGSPGEEVGG